MPLGLIITLNVVVLLAVALVLYFVLRPSSASQTTTGVQAPKTPQLQAPQVQAPQVTPPQITPPAIKP